MKTSFTSLVLVSLTCLQYLSSAPQVHAQANYFDSFFAAAVTTTAGGATAGATTSAGAAPTATSTGGIVTPSPPSFVNTPGLQVSSPYDGMFVKQNTVMSISASLIDQQPISSINISVAKKDGSSNTTIVNISSGAILSASQIWNVTAAAYPIGDYLFNMIITPNTTANANPAPAPVVATSSAAGSTATTNAVTPAPTGTVPGPVSSVYYWQAIIHVTAPPSTTTTTVPSSAIGLKEANAGTVAMLVAAGAAVIGSLLAL